MKSIKAMSQLEKIHVESVLVGNLLVAISGERPSPDPRLNITANLAEQSLTVTFGNAPFRYLMNFYVKNFLEFRRYFNAYINPAKFTFNGEVYHPRRFPILFQQIRYDYVFLFNTPVYYHWPREEWLCWQHSRKYSRLVVGLSTVEKCRRCVEELQRLKLYHRNTTCLGCRRNHYNFARQDDIHDIVVDEGAGCWFLRDIKEGRCLHYSK